jgi:peptidyl-dipeptidase Dcp
MEAIGEASEEIRKIADNQESPTFENTVAALDKAGEKIGRIASVLFNLNSAETSPEIQAAAMDVSPLLTRFSNDITLNPVLFKRIKNVYDSGIDTDFDEEKKMLLERKYRSFRLGGAELSEEDQVRFREVSEELSKLTLRFEENVLSETNAFILHLTEKDDLTGLPAGIIEQAAAEASSRQEEGWLFTLHHPSYIPFMQYSDKRELREKMLRAYSSRSFNGNEADNSDLVRQIVNFRLEMAKMLGYKCYADMVLEERMAESKEKVTDFLEKLFAASHPAALRDFTNLSNFASGAGQTDRLERWDWAYFSEKLRKVKYDIDDEILKPYFRLENTESAIFSLAEKLYGIRFISTGSVPVYHKEVKTWEVMDEKGRHLALFYADYHPRAGKSGGAWMTTYREQRVEDGRNIRPIVSIVTNFSRPTETLPSLLTFMELTTFLHEFGHALHAIFSECTYETLSGTNVPRDFVELPSQIMENWAFEKEWLESWAVHYETGETIPFEIIRRIRESSTFNEGYACDRQLGFSFLDMGWHTLTGPFSGSIQEFETGIMKKTSLFPEIAGSNMSCSFTHLFGGGYAAGYYGYKWAEVLDADAFRLFREKGVFDRQTAESFRKNILSKGGSARPMELYIKFRGKEPSLEPLLERSGLKG